MGMDFMETFEAIITRRSIRQFSTDPVDDQICLNLLEAGMQAPSAHNAQPWHFVLIDKRDVLFKISQIHPYAGMLNHAPLAIAVCGDLRIEKNIEYLGLNCAAATENILLAAHALNLGAVWLGIYPRKERMNELSKLLNLPEKVPPITLIAIGKAAEKKPAENRFKQDRIHKNEW
jgi:nitroreductase